METIDLKEYRRSGAGANGESYDSLLDPDLMLKLYNTTYPTQSIIDELDVARKVYSLGVPSPEPGELVTDGTRIGIRFRRIRGKRSFSRMLADEPERVRELTVEMTRAYKALHSIPCPEGLFPDVRSRMLTFAAADRAMTPQQKERFVEFVKSAPEEGTCLHGDMHMGNIISTLPKGAPLDAPHNLYFIDLGYFGRGCPLFDIGMMRQVCLYADKDFVFKEYHITPELARKVWDCFTDEYFFSEDRLAEKYFGPGQTPESVEKALAPYMCGIYLFIEYVFGSLPPGADRLFAETF